SAPPPRPPPEVSWEEQKRRRNRQKALPAQRDRVLEEIDVAEARRKAIQELYCTPGFFEQTPPDRIAALEAEDKSLITRVESLTAEWEKLEAEIESLGPPPS
ncbi:MAG TPA: hypothetical protein VFS00_13835, partial [Polyangiaceae bacterium]|nr:hypothetical protein [Polyangiaceae bacterium]